MTDRDHAKLSASGAKRWLACPKSVALEEEEEERESSFALEGTLAHTVAETLLKLKTGQISSEEYLKKLEELEVPLLGEMTDNVSIYVELCLESLDEMKLLDPKAIALIETRVEFTDWVPEGFGTCDFMVIGGGRLILRDLKYGKGVPVSAEDNPQVRLYALGAIQEFGYIYDIEEVEMHIDQPRLNAFTTEIMRTKELIEWGNSIKDRALLAFNGGGEAVAGEHCRFCRVRATCKVRARSVLSVINDIINSSKEKKSMKMLFDYCRQTRRYGDSEGQALIELGGGATIDDVIKKYVDVKREFWEQRYLNPRAIKRIEYNKVTYEGNLVLMDTHQLYLD